MFIFKTKSVEVTVESGEKVNPDGFENNEPYLRVATGPNGKTFFKRKTHCIVTYPDGNRVAVLNDRVKDILEGPFDELFPEEESLDDKVAKAVADALAGSPDALKREGRKVVSKKYKMNEEIAEKADKAKKAKKANKPKIPQL